MGRNVDIDTLTCKCVVTEEKVEEPILCGMNVSERSYLMKLKNCPLCRADIKIT